MPFFPLTYTLSMKIFTYCDKIHTFVRIYDNDMIHMKI